MLAHNQINGNEPKSENGWPNPIDDVYEVTFLQMTGRKQKQIADKALREVTEENSCLGAGNWNFTVCMHLTHMLIDFDNIKQQFLLG